MTRGTEARAPSTETALEQGFAALARASEARHEPLKVEKAMNGSASTEKQANRRALTRAAQFSVGSDQLQLGA
jgi:hypothetical protein